MDEIVAYYRDRVLAHGANAAGVDWKSEESQRLRFEQLARLLPEALNPVSVLDYGCGYGALYEFLAAKIPLKHYCGFDLVPEMLAHARDRHQGDELSWCSALVPDKVFDYAFASGVFNVRLSASDEEWKKYIFESLSELNSRCSKGFAVNFLTSYSDRPLQKDYLYYASPLEIFDFCKTSLSKSVALLHDYPLYEFSILVQKEG